MFSGRSHCKFILTVCLTAAMPVLAKPGYLASLGPVPLRFLPSTQPARRTGTVSTMNTEPATIRHGDEAVTAPKLGNPPAGTPPPMAAVTNEVNTEMPPLEPDAVVSPEMLLKYFNRSTNGASMEILAPMNVIPTRLPEPPSSKATYSN